MNPFIIRGPILNPITREKAEWLPDGAIVVSGRGTIEFLGSDEALPERYGMLASIEYRDCIIAPGFVDLHVHLPQYFVRGKYGASLLEWLERFVFPEEERFASSDYAQSIASLFFSDLKKSGTTTAVVYAPSYLDAVHAAFEEAERSKLRIVMGKTEMDRNVPPALHMNPNDALRETESLIQSWHRKTERLFYAVTPRFAAACSPEFMRGLAQLASAYDTFIQTHINETQDEVALTRRLFPHAVHYAGVYDEAQLLSPRTILAHNLHPSDTELDLCEERGCAVAHCPDSNLFLGSGQFPLEKYLSRAIRWGLGCDVGAGTTLSMFTVMRSMAHVQLKSLSPLLLLHTATLGGAQALGFEATTGNFAVGKSFDAVVVKMQERIRRRPLESISIESVASAYVYLTEASDVVQTYCCGDAINDVVSH